jgi:hypothetical protein
MSPNDNRRPGQAPGNGGDDYDSSNSANVIRLFPKIKPTASPFDGLTARTIIAHYRAGTLAEGVLLALMAGVGLQP